MSVESLAGIYILGHWNERGTVGCCERCAHVRLSWPFAEQLGTGLAVLAGSQGLRLPGTARRHGFGLRRIN